MTPVCSPWADGRGPGAGPHQHASRHGVPYLSHWSSSKRCHSQHLGGMLRERTSPTTTSKPVPPEAHSPLRGRHDMTTVTKERGAMATPDTHDGLPASGTSDAQPPDNRMSMIIRHAEKPHPTGSPYGVTPYGQQDPHSLSVTGWIRAGALVQLFVPARGEPLAGLRRPDTYRLRAHGGHSKRSIQRSHPLAAQPGLWRSSNTMPQARRPTWPRRSTRPGTSSPGTTRPSTASATTSARSILPRPNTGRPTVSTSSGPSPHDGTDGGSPRSRNSSSPGDLPHPIAARSALHEAHRRRRRPALLTR